MFVIGMGLDSAIHVLNEMKIIFYLLKKKKKEIEISGQPNDVAKNIKTPRFT